MALWLVRAGRHGEYEQRFLNEDRIYLTWSGLSHDLSKMESASQVKNLMQKTYPSFSKNKLAHHSGQVRTFLHRIKPGDWVILPSKLKSSIHVAEVTGEYKYVPGAEDRFYHYRPVKWIQTDIPRSNFDQDLLYSLGAFMTICRISRNNAEKRIRAMADTGWHSAPVGPTPLILPPEATIDLERVSRDQISALIKARFAGDSMERLVEGILKAQGYTTYHSPTGPDKGVDLLAAQGPLGFRQPRICVQVKSGNNPLERTTLDQLVGTMQNFHADHGLLVSWGGFKSSVDKEKAIQFFRVRLWDQEDLIDHILEHYDRLDLNGGVKVYRVAVEKCTTQAPS